MALALAAIIAATALPASAAAGASQPADFGLSLKHVPNRPHEPGAAYVLRVRNIRKWTATSVRACAAVPLKRARVVGVSGGGAVRFKGKSACWIVRAIKPHHAAALRFDVRFRRGGAKKGRKTTLAARADGGNSYSASHRFHLAPVSAKKARGHAGKKGAGKKGAGKKGAGKKGAGKKGAGKRATGKKAAGPRRGHDARASVSPVAPCVAPQTLGVVFVTDDSGSMEESDPTNLRSQAIAVGLDQLPDGSLAAATSFSDYSTEMFGVTAVSAATRPGLKADAKNLYDYGDTEYEEAFAGARTELGQMPGADRRAVIFLSDGVPTDSYFDPETPVDVGGAPIFTIGLGVDGDPEAASILSHIAAGSSGQYYDAQSAGQLQGIFAQIVASLTCGAQALTESFPLAPGESRSIPFAVEPEDGEFRALAAWNTENVTVTAQRPDATSMTPGTLNPGEAFVNEPTYALLTASDPAVGGWNLIVTANQGNLSSVNVSIDVFKKALALPPPPPPPVGRSIDPCMAAYPKTSRQRKKIFGGHDEIYDRAESLFQVCAGFGAPEALNLSPEMKCALVAAAATFGGPPLSIRADQACNVISYANAFRTGDWLGAAGGAACGYFGEALAGAAGIVAAGATAESGPGAVSIGLYTYRALAAGMKIACGGLFAGGATAVGTKLEADHEMHIALDVTRKGRCIAYRERFSLVSWRATDCP